MKFHGVDGDGEVTGDLAVGHALCHELHHLGFPGRERAQPVSGLLHRINVQRPSSTIYGPNDQNFSLPLARRLGVWFRACHILLAHAGRRAVTREIGVVPPDEVAARRGLLVALERAYPVRFTLFEDAKSPAAVVGFGVAPPGSGRVPTLRLPDAKEAETPQG